MEGGSVAEKKLAYVCDLTHTGQTVALNTVPFSVAGLVSYAKSKLPDPEAMEFRIFKYPEKLIAAVLERNPDITCFSNYMWNFDLGYSLAERIKRRNPRAVAIFGGPNYPTDRSEQERFLRDHPLIDFHAYKEGEIAFSELIGRLLAADLDVGAVKLQKPRSCHFLIGDEFVEGELIERIKDLEEIPSPYLTGEMDEFFDDLLVPMIQTNRGCPFACTFCVEGLGYYNKVNKRAVATIRRELEYIAARKHPKIHDLHIVDSNFGMYREDEAIADAIAEVQERYHWPEYIHVATGKNQKERVLKVAKTIKGALRLSGAVQSLSDQVLENIKRSNISADQLMELARKARELGSNTYSEIIVALPGETKESHFQTIEVIVNAKFNYARIYTLMLLPGVEMSNLETREKYRMDGRFRVVPRCLGRYAFGEETSVLSAEIEEVCVATKDMPFEDYVDCRLFHLTVEVFYNDGVSAELVEFLNRHDISVFDWLKHIHDQRQNFPERLRSIYDGFEKETRNELWPSREELVKFVKDEAVIGKYLSGEYGSNLIFKHKTLALTGALEDLLTVAHRAARSILGEKSPDLLAANSEYLEELRIYGEAKRANFFDTSLTLSHRFHYDFLELEKQFFKAAPEDFHRPEGLLITFAHTPGQKQIIEDSLRLYGRDVVGISRVFSKVNVSKLYRALDYQPG